MSVSKEVINTLKHLGVPVSFQTSKSGKFPYITFFTYLDTGRLHSDDKETITGYFVQVDVWSKTDYTSLVKDIHESMLTANINVTIRIPNSVHITFRSSARQVFFLL